MARVARANHATSTGAWLVTWRSRSAKRGLPYEDAVQEALCFGWVDGTAGTIDEERGKQYYARASPAVAGPPPTRPASSGSSRRAAWRQQGWPPSSEPRTVGAARQRRTAGGAPDLAAALDAHPPAATNFAAFPPSVRKRLLGSIVMARRQETR